MKPNTISRFLGACFIVYGALLAVSLWHHLTVTLPLLRGGETTHWTVTALKSVSSTRFLWLVMALVAGIGMFKAARWARWLGVFLAGSVPVGDLSSALMFGAAVALTPMSLCVSLIAIIVFLFLWRSRQAKEMFGYDPKAARNAWMALGGLCLIPAMLFGFVIYIKAKHGLPRFTLTSQVVQPVGRAIEKDFVQRELSDFRVTVPNNVPIISFHSENSGTSVALGTPDKKMWVMVSSGALGELMKQVGQAIGMNTPYDIHRHLLWSRWNVIFVILQAVSIPNYGDDVWVTESETPKWRALVIQGRKNDVFRAEYSIYSREDSLQTASCFWYVQGKVLTAAQIEDGMSAFEFLTATRTRSQYMQEAGEALAGGRQLDAQFALAQAYLQNEKDLVVTRKLADVSAELGSWQLVKKLAQELLADNPGNREVKVLYERALKASEQKDAGGSEKEVSPARLN